MAAGQTVLTGADANGNALNLLAGSDVSGDVSPGHTLFDVTGVAIGTQTNPLRVITVGTTLVSKSVASTVANTSTQLAAANSSRKVLRIQAPQTIGIWINPLGGTCAANAVDCIWIGPGVIYESRDTNAVTYLCTSAAKVIVAFEGT